MDNTNAERQRRYIARLKAKASVSNAADAAEIATLKAEVTKLRGRVKELEAAAAAAAPTGDRYSAAHLAAVKFETVSNASFAKKAMSAEAKEAARAKAKATRELHKRIKAAYDKEREFKEAVGRKLKKVEAVASDLRGEANTRAVAESMAEKLRHSKPPPNPYRPPPLPERLPPRRSSRARPAPRVGKAKSQ